MLDNKSVGLKKNINNSSVIGNNINNCEVTTKDLTVTESFSIPGGALLIDIDRSFKYLNH